MSTLEEKIRRLEEARKRMIEKIEEARREYLQVKQQLFPELFAPSPTEAIRIINEQRKRILELEERLRLLERGGKP